MLVFEWQGRKWKLKKKENMEYEIKMKARDGSNATLAQREVNNPEEILGV